MSEVFRKDHEDKIRATEGKEHKRIKCEEKRKQREAEKQRCQVITEQKKAGCEVKRQQKEEECRGKAVMREIGRKERQKLQHKESMTSESSPEFSNDNL